MLNTTVNPFIFREYDIRGVVDRDLTVEGVSLLGEAFAGFFLQRNVATIAVGRDCRLSSPAFAQAVIDSLLRSGVQVVDLGVVPTPILYYSQFLNESVDAAIMVTGSHNPKDNNGFKLGLRRQSVYGDDIQEIRKRCEALASNRSENAVAPSNSARQLDLIPRYLDDLAARFMMGPRKLKVIVDPGNGVGGLTGPELYRRLGCEVIEMFCEPDGNFPNHHPDPTVPANLTDSIEAVKRLGADLVIAIDGDADRIGAIDQEGNVLWGDQLMILFSRQLLENSPGATVIGEVKCSQLLFDDIAKSGGVPLMSKVGHSLIKTKMKETGALLAGEMSGHIFFADRYYGFDDAVYAGARLLEILSHSDKTLSGLLADLPKTQTTPEIRRDCSDELKFQTVEKLKRLLQDRHPQLELVLVDGVRIKFPEGWGLVRASNTQPILVLRFEASSQELLAQYQQTVEELLVEIAKSFG
jgi:phosphomannomutase / phosphoglucomutase